MIEGMKKNITEKTVAEIHVKEEADERNVEPFFSLLGLEISNV